MFTAATLALEDDETCKTVANCMEPYHVIDSDIIARVPAMSIRRKVFVWTPDVHTSTLERSPAHFKMVAFVTEKKIKNPSFLAPEASTPTCSEEDTPLSDLYSTIKVFKDLDMRNAKEK